MVFLNRTGGQKMNLDNTENRSAFQVAADWKFDPAYIHAGSLEENDLVLKDVSGEGNHLRLNLERVPEGKTASSFMRFLADGIYGDGEEHSLQMEPLALDGEGKKKGAFWETIPEAPINQEEFRQGYTLEVILKLPVQVSEWSSVFGRKGTGKLAGMQGGTRSPGRTRMAFRQINGTMWSSKMTGAAPS